MIKGIYLLRRNSFFALSSTAIRLLSNAVMFIVIARFYGPESFGQFTTAHTLSTIFILLADFGFDMLLTTQIAADNQRASVILPRMLGLKLVFSFFASTIMCAVPLLGNLSVQASKLIYIFSLYVFFSAALNFFFALFKGYEEFQHEALISLLLNVLLLVALIFLGFMKASLPMDCMCIYRFANFWIRAGSSEKQEVYSIHSTCLGFTLVPRHKEPSDIFWFVYDLWYTIFYFRYYPSLVLERRLSSWSISSRIQDYCHYIGDPGYSN